MPETPGQPVLRVSVIIPTYNRAGYLREALESVRNQGLPPWEIIVVDDGSTDDTVQVIQEAGIAVRYFLQPHLGVAAARNLGLSGASGDLVAWLDSDDLWEENFLSTVVPVLVQDPMVDGIYTGITMIDSGGARLRSAVRVEPPEKLYEALVRDNFLATPSIVVRKSCYDRTGGFDARFRIGEDYDMWLRLAKRFRIMGLVCPLVRIRVHGTNTMGDLETACAARLGLVEKHFGVLGASRGHLPEAAMIAYGYAYRSVALRHIAVGQAPAGWAYLEKAVTFHPAMLAQLGTFYELALGEQARGCRGDVSRLDVEATGVDLLNRLDALFSRATPEVRALRGRAYGYAYLALGMLSDQAGQWGSARCSLARAIRHNPRLLGSLSIWRRLLKLSLGKRTVQLVRSRARGTPMLDGDHPLGGKR